jgi:multidrug efflux pump subunit AcrB
MEAEMATRMSIIVGVILSFLWFAYLFGQILNTTIIIALGALGVIGGIVAIMKNSPPL